MSDNDERVNAQLIRFFEKVILNTANTYYKKQEEIQNMNNLINSHHICLLKIL